MKENNIFNKDVEIPEVVLKKAELALSQLESKGEPVMEERRTEKVSIAERKNATQSSKKIRAFRRLVAVAACLALVVTGLRMGNVFHKEEAGIQTAMDHFFTIKVMAKELQRGIALPTEDWDGPRQWFYGGSADGEFSYSFNLPLSVEGEGIKSVTYGINSGAFEIASLTEDPFVVSGVAYTGDHPESTYENNCDMAGQYIGEMDVNYYREFTVDYAKQRGKDSVIGVVNQMQNRADLFQRIFDEGDSSDDAHVRDTLNEMLLRDIRITCLVTFEDGMTMEEEIELRAHIYKEHDVTADGEEYDYDMLGIFCIFAGDDAALPNPELNISMHSEAKLQEVEEEYCECGDEDDTEFAEDTQFEEPNPTDERVVRIWQETEEEAELAAEGAPCYISLDDEGTAMRLYTVEFEDSFAQEVWIDYNGIFELLVTDKERSVGEAFFLNFGYLERYILISTMGEGDGEFTTRLFSISSDRLTETASVPGLVVDTSDGDNIMIRFYDPTTANDVYKDIAFQVAEGKFITDVDLQKLWE